MNATSQNDRDFDEFDPGAAEHSKTAVIVANEAKVKRGFWRKLGRAAGRIPFAEDAVAAYFCAADPATPTRVRGTLLAALAYFILPADLVPDFILGLGFTDDATVLAMALGLVSSHLTPQHREAARKALEQRDITPQKKPPPPED